MSADWTEIRHSIISRLDVACVYREMGLRVPERSPGARGWIDCHAAGREDANPSARINVRTGYYKDYKTGESCNLFDFAARYGSYPSWKEARKAFAARAGVSLPSGGEPKRPADALEFLLYRKSDVRIWCESKEGISPEAVAEAGGRLAMWPKTSDPRFQQSVIAFPGYGPYGLEDDPVAWVIVNAEGGDIRLFRGKGEKPTFHKSLCLGGSQPCLLNAHAVNHLEDAEVVWKVEGLTDMLSFQTWIPEEFKGKHVVVTNGFGCAEQPQQWMLQLMKGKQVAVVGDADVPGQKGALAWVAHLHAFARSVHNVQLPYEVSEKHGKDLRDFHVETAVKQNHPLPVRRRHLEGV